MGTRISKSDTSCGSAIDIRLREIGQLFNTLDPSPFQDRDLDPDAEDHIVEWARELPKDAKLAIRIHMPPDEARKARERDVGRAVSNYFAARAVRADSDLRELLRTGWHYLPIGLIVLALCLIASQMVKPAFGASRLADVVEEGLVIVGWVANWKPLEIFLYDWWPIARRRDLFRRLRDADVEVIDR